MKTLKIEELNAENFAGYGVFTDMLNPKGFVLGTPPGGFYRDMLTMPVGMVAGFSNSRALKKEMRVEEIECHDGAAEAFLPLDGDVVLAVGEATIRSMPPVHKMRAFRVPKGTLVVLNAGTWHSGEYAVDVDAVNVFTVLPERCYALDCFFYKLDENDRFMME